MPNPWSLVSPESLIPSTQGRDASRVSGIGFRLLGFRGFGYRVCCMGNVRQTSPQTNAKGPPFLNYKTPIPHPGDPSIQVINTYIGPITCCLHCAISIPIYIPINR